MGGRVLDAALVVLTLCAVVTTALVVRREFFPAAQAQAPRPEKVPEWRSFAREGHRMGPVEAPVTIVVFSDFQCPFCAVLMSRLDEVRRAHPGDLAIVYRHFPLASHPHALSAARASDCAAEQDRFAAFHDALFAAQDSIGVVPWTRFATVAGVPDQARFQSCVKGTGALATVERDAAAARRLRVTGTPTLLINDVRLQGSVRLDTLEAYVRRALQSSSRS